MNVGFIGTGNIAGTVAKTLKKLDSKDIVLYACASRSKEKAEFFGRKYGFNMRYGSYDDLLDDKNVDLVYIATPHSAHFAIAKTALSHGKNVLVEKPITTDISKLNELITLAEKQGLMLTEAFWTAYDPLVLDIKKRIAENEFGKIIKIRSSFRQPIKHVKRLVVPSLAGGALLDLGVYSLFHSFFYTDSELKNVVVRSEKHRSGVDETTSGSLVFNNYSSDFSCSIASFGSNRVIIDAEKATIKFNNINFPTSFTIKRSDNLRKERKRISAISGYEFEFLEIQKYLKNGEIDSDLFPHSFSRKIISCCDLIRKDIGLVYPFD